MKKLVLILSTFLLFTAGMSLTTDPYSPAPKVSYKITANGIHGRANLTVMHEGQIYSERWDTLAHVNFWRTTMNMPAETALINIASTRAIVGKIALSDWHKRTQVQKDAFKDSIKAAYHLPADEIVYFTGGKNFFYKFKDAIPDIDRAIPIFEQQGVDPFFAQAILLIESPGRLQKSNVGAYGSFQLMKGVAKNMGLKVNKKVDERKDFNKCAWASAKLIRTVCVPYTNAMLEKRGIAYNPQDLWYKLLVLHVYHAGAGNVAPALDKIGATQGGKELVLSLWKTKCANFGNASQNYSQIALAALLELEHIVYNNCNELVLE